jgi:hypothetical protein
MKLIVLTGEAKVGKTHALELLKKANDGTIEYFEDDVSYSDIPKLLKRKEKLGVVVAYFSKGRDTVDTREFSFKNVFVISSDNNFMSGKKEFYVNRFIDRESKLPWTEAFHWLKSNSVGTELTASTTEEKPKIVDEFFSYICK